MAPKKHTWFNYKQIGVFIFLFLNCFLTAAPFINAAAENNRYVQSQGDFSHNNYPTDQDDGGRSNSSENQQEYPVSIQSKHSVTHHLKTQGNYTFLFSITAEIASDHCIGSSTFLVTPAYYIFLSRYKLF